MNRWSFLAVLVIVAGAVGGFATYTFGYRDTGWSGLGRAEKDRIAGIVSPRITDKSYYVEDIKRTSPRHYLVRYANVDHPSFRECFCFTSISRRCEKSPISKRPVSDPPGHVHFTASV